MSQLSKRLWETEAPHCGYDIEHTTLNVGVIKGGVASNIVAENCEFRFDIRHLPSTSPASILRELERFAADELLPEMRSIAPEAAITFECLGRVPALDTQETAPLVSWVTRLLGTTAPPAQVGFGTEAGLFDAAGIPDVICGPGSIEQAHKPDEFVTLEQLVRCEHFMSALILAEPPEERACH